MAKLYFKYGVMGSSKTAQALITKFNYEERGMSVWLLKPATDTRDGKTQLRSRIGLCAEAYTVSADTDIVSKYREVSPVDVIIADECQFFTEEQIDQLRAIVDSFDIPVICFGLRTDFLTKFFPGSRRLFEIADSIEEIKSMCECGNKAIVNARINSEGKIVTVGEQVMLGGNDSYIELCHRCWKKRIKREQG